MPKTKVKESKYVPGPFSKAGYAFVNEHKDLDRCKCGHFYDDHSKKGKCTYSESDGKKHLDFLLQIFN